MNDDSAFFLDDWQDAFGARYLELNAFQSCEALWLHVVEHAGNLAETLRLATTMNSLATEPPLTHALAWTLAFATRLGAYVSDVTWHKYPLACPYCIHRHDRIAEFVEPDYVADHFLSGATFAALARCKCGLQGYADFHENEKTLAALRAHDHRKPTQLGQFQDMFGALYRANHLSQTQPTTMAYHMLEEINEVAQEIRQRRYAECLNEVADVFSWICSLATHHDIDLEKALEREYPDVDPWSVR